MARRSRDASPQRRSQSSSSNERQIGAPRESAQDGGPAREDEEDREHRAFHARTLARKAEAEDRDSEPPRR